MSTFRSVQTVEKIYAEIMNVIYFPVIPHIFKNYITTITASNDPGYVYKSYKITNDVEYSSLS